MLLTIDAGNTSINFGVFDGDNLVKTFKLPSNNDLSAEDYLELIKNQSLTNIEGCIIASVVSNLDTKLKNAVDKVYNINSIVLSTEMDCGIKLILKNSQTAGVDRIANAVCAKQLYRIPAIVVDAGTAITFDTVNKNGDFIGGAIMPGIKTQLKSLNTNTSKLPDIKIGTTSRAIGDNTKDAMLSGVVRGSAYAMDGLIQAFENELGEKAFLVGTGGDIEILAQYMNTKFDIINPNLTLEGLKFIYYMNKN